MTSIRTYRQLDRRCRAIAGALQDTLDPGERALLVLPPGPDFTAAFLGCLYAGVVAVPAYPPYREQQLQALSGIVASAEPAVFLAPSSLAAALQVISSAPCISLDEISEDTASVWSLPAIGPESLAFLQYTSGSTSAPKGVMVSHRNLLHNSESICRAFELGRDSVSVTWLPSYHDMGLIDGIIQPIYGGFPGYIMSPAAFLQRPLRWLEAISRFRATHSGGPNFAYELCVKKTTLQERQGLDLRSWVTAYNGAEPVREDTLRRFSAAFAVSGFRSRFFYPCYGLAEATLMVTGGFVYLSTCDRTLGARGHANERKSSRAAQSAR